MVKIKERASPAVSIIIPTYNPGNLLSKCLASIPRHDVEVIVVDNGSKDGEVEKAKDDYPWVKFIFLGRNTGFAYACNHASRHAKGEFLLFSNQDSEILEAGFDAVARFIIDHPRCAIASGKICYPDGRLQETLRRFPGYTAFLFGRRTPLTRLFPANPLTRHYLYQDIDYEKNQEVDICTGMFLFVRKGVFFEVGGFDEGFFFYVEDFDFCRRIKDAGWEIWYVAAKAALHYIGENLLHTDRTYVKMHHYKGIYRYLIKHKKPNPLLKGLLWIATGLAITIHLALSRIRRNFSGSSWS